jgi:hypothetical protein
MVMAKQAAPKSAEESRHEVRREVAAFSLAIFLFPVLGVAGGKALPPPDLPEQHSNPSGHVTFQTPADWTVSAKDGARIDAWGQDLGLRLVERDGEQGLDSFHVDCMMERLAPPMETEPQVAYEYDFIGGMVNGARALDSAFAVRYDKEIRGHRQWRQRNVSLVGSGRSLCVVAYAPAERWKKSAESRALLDAVLSSVLIK